MLKPNGSNSNIGGYNPFLSDEPLAYELFNAQQMSDVHIFSNRRLKKKYIKIREGCVVIQPEYEL